MKFYCDSCQTKYSIADEKVRGKVLKVRCKNCSHIITVREPDTPKEAVPKVAAAAKKRSVAAPPKPKPKRRIQWHYSINGQSFGPFEEAELKGKFSSGELGDAVYVWNETFRAWKVVGEVGVFREALAAGTKIRRPKSTVGVSGALEAIDREKIEAQAEEAKAPLESGLSAQKDRLEALRSRLKLDETEPKKEEASPEEEKAEVEGAEEEEQAQEEEVVSVKRFDLDLSIIDDEEESGGDHSFDQDEQEGESGTHDGLFAGMDSGAVGAQEQLDQRQAEEDAVPFFGAAPKLGKEGAATSMSGKEEITGSLLIQLNAIKSDGRKRAVATVIGAILAVSVVGAVGYYGLTQRAEVEEDDRPRVRANHVGQAPQFRGYSEEDRMRANTIVGQELVISRDVSRAAYEDEQEREASAAPGAAGRASPTVEAPRIDPSAFRPVAGDDGATRAIDDGRGARGERFQGVGLAGIGSDEGAASPRLGSLAEAGMGDLEDDRLRAMAALQTDTQRGIYNPTGEVIEAPQRRERLSNQDIAQGMQNVMASVGACRERHIMRGGALSEDRVEVTLEILPTGRIGEFALAPRSLVDTDFGRCMNSHTRRWRFPPFQQSEPMEVRTPFLLQD